MVVILSIIIPVYNVEHFIRKTLNSIFNQEFDASCMEIIVVNDGTPDHSMDIVSEFAQLYPIVVINQENKGLSEARNTGLRAAKGDYVWFVDSDDWIESHNLPELFKTIRINQADVFIFGLCDQFENGKPPQKRKLIGVDTNSDFIPADLIKVFYSNNRPLTPIQQYIFSRHYLLNNNLLFKKEIFHEDTELIPRLLFSTNHISYSPCVIYNYWHRSGSICTSAGNKTKRISDVLEMIETHKDYSLSFSGADAYSMRLYRIYEASFIFNTLDLEIWKNFSKSKAWRIIKKDIIITILSSRSFTEFKRRFVFVLSPSLLLRMHKRL